MEVKLRQIVGKQLGNPTGPDIASPIDFVMVDGCTVGHIGHAPGSCINFIKRLPVADCEAVIEEVRKLRAASVQDQFGMIAPMEHLESADEDEEDDD